MNNKLVRLLEIYLFRESANIFFKKNNTCIVYIHIYINAYVEPIYSI